MPLPFPDAAFERYAVSRCLSCFQSQAALNEMRGYSARQILLTSRGTEESGRKAKVKSAAELTSMLRTSRFENIRITRWWKLFDRVLTAKNGTARPVGVKPLIDVLQCRSCGQSTWMKTAHTLRCTNCGHELLLTPEGIVLN